MAIVQDIEADLLGLIGIEDISHSDLRTRERILSDINAAIETLYSRVDNTWTSTEGGALVFSPASFAGVSVVKGDTSISAAGLTPNMNGCTLQISGDPSQNQLRHVGVNEWELAMPFSGESDTNASATVWFDAIVLSDTVISVKPPVQLVGVRDLYPMHDITKNKALVCDYNGYNPHLRNYVGYAYSGSTWYTERDVADPIAYVMETMPTPDGGRSNCIRLNPMPAVNRTVRFRYQFKPEPVLSLADPRKTIAPLGYDRSIIIPLCRKFFSGWIHFGAQDKLPQIEFDFQNATAMMEKLNDNQPLRPVYISHRGNW